MIVINFVAAQEGSNEAAVVEAATCGSAPCGLLAAVRTLRKKTPFTRKNSCILRVTDCAIRVVASGFVKDCLRYSSAKIFLAVI